MNRRNPAQSIQRLAKPIYAWILLALVLPFNLYLFRYRREQLAALSGIDEPIVDTWFAYTPGEFYDLAERLGEEGRNIYALSEVTLDLVYPVLLNLLLLILLAILLPKAFGLSERLQRLVFLPLASLSADYLENAGITALLLRYPNQITWLAWLTSLMTVVKFLLYLAGLGLALFSAILLAKRALAKRKQI